MKRTSFLLSLAGALVAGATTRFVTPPPPVRLRMVGEEDCFEADGEGATLAEAMRVLIADIESQIGAPLEEHNRETFAEAEEALQDRSTFRHWDFSSPEEAFYLIRY